jgi:hypothetical protein
MGILDRIREHKHEDAPGPSAHEEPLPTVAQDAGSNSVAERIAAAKVLAGSAGFHVPQDADTREQQVAALAVPGDGSVPRRLVAEFDAETDDDVRMGIVTALTDVFIDVDERYQLAGLRGVQLTHEDQHTLAFLRAELPRLIEEVQRAQRSGGASEGDGH